MGLLFYQSIAHAHTQPVRIPCTKRADGQKPQQTPGWLKFPSANRPQGQTKHWMEVIQLQAYLPVGQISKGWRAFVGNTLTELSMCCLEVGHHCTVFQRSPTSTTFQASPLLCCWYCLNRKAFDSFHRLTPSHFTNSYQKKQITQSHNIPPPSYSSQHIRSVILAPQAQNPSQTTAAEWIIPTSFQIPYPFPLAENQKETRQYH